MVFNPALHQALTVSSNLKQHDPSKTTDHLEHIKTKFDALYKAQYPTTGGKEVLGIDLVLLDSDTMGLVDSFLATKGNLTFGKLKMLKDCSQELQKIVPYLDENERKYFSALEQLAHDTLSSLNRTNK